MADGEAAATESASLVALLRHGRRDHKTYVDLVEDAGSAHAILEQEHGLLTTELIEAATEEIAGWQRSGIQLLTVLEADYPENLRSVHDRPPLIFLVGRLKAGDARAVAVIGSRKASPAAIATANHVAAALVDHKYTVISGLARGIDTAAHTSTLARRGRTLAVIGNGVQRRYPSENAELQRQIAAEGAVVSQFWPETAPAKAHFPLRNAVMSGMSLATVIVEAGLKSGARTQARLALAHGRPVLIMHNVLAQEWARELAKRPAVHVVRAPEDVPRLVDELASAEIVAT